MSKAHHPPSTLSEEDVLELKKVRRDIWLDGFYGMAVGSVSGLALHSGASLYGRYRKLPLTLSKNTALAWFLGGGALGSFVMATTKGTNEVHRLYPIFQRGALTPDAKTVESVTEQVERLRREEEERHQRERNRLFRRKTLQSALEGERFGLNDAHGGHWVDEQEKR